MARRKSRSATAKMSRSSYACNCMHHAGSELIFGILVLTFGLVALLNTLGVVSQAMFDLAWPIIVIIIGIKYLSKTACNCC